MTRRRGGGGGAAKPDRILRHHVECARNSYSTIEQLVNHLRSTYAYYSRDNLQTLTNRVSRIIRVSSRRNDTMVESNDDGGTPITKKRRKIDEEEKLRLVEAQHSDVLNHGGGGGGGSISSVASASSSDGNDLSDEEASTSMDAVYGKKIEPEFDLMKSMLREKLSQKSKKLGGGRGVTEAAELKDVKESALMKSMLREKKSKKFKKLRNGSDVKEVMELEVVDNKDMKEVHSMNKEGKLGDVWSKIEKETDNIGSSSSNEIDWPTFKYFGGMNGVINALKKQVILPFRYPHLARRLGVEPITGILLHGPPGCGKTTLAYAIANETGVPFYKVSAPELVSGVSGASEENIRELFSKANRTAPSVVFIDEIDAIASKRENLRGMELRIVTQLLTCMDESSRLVQSDNNNVGSRSSYYRAGYVLVIGATNRPDALDPALRRPGRFEREFLLGVPDEYARVQILSTLTRNLKVEDAFDLVKIARSTPGFVGADLKALVKEAGIFAINRIIGDNVELSMEQKEPPVSDEVMENLSITMADFEEAVNVVQPSAKREGFSDIPNVKWDDVGGLHLLRQEFDRCIIRRVKFPEVYEDIGLDLETGFLLYGPPGCGKTLIAKAVANEAGTSFIHIKGPELLSKYVGESESAVRIIFSRARTCSPCIIFFDEVDALTTRRGREGGWIVERLLNQLLIELDGAEQRRGVYVIGATNRPEVMDPAVLRPGRLGKLLYVPLPSPDERGMILKTLARNKTIDANVDLMAIGKDSACENFSGADLSALMNEAVLAALEDNPFGRSSSSPWSVKDAHFKRALEKMSPSVSDEQIECYNLLLKNLKAA